MKITNINNIISIVSLVFLLSLIGCSSDKTHTCNYCGDSYKGKGFTTMLAIVNQVEDEDSILNSYCSRECAIAQIRSMGREPLTDVQRSLNVPQPEGPTPEGKIWSTEHGHWHDIEK